MTVAEIEAQVAANLNRVGVAAVDTRLGTWVQDELREWGENAVWKGETHDWSFLTATHNLGTVATQQTYPLTALTGFLRPIRLWFEFTGGDRVTYMELEVLRQMYYGRNDSYPEHYGLAFNEDGVTPPTLWLFPPPLQAWTGHLTYQKKPAAISGVQQNIFTIRWADGLIAGATARGLRLLRGHEEAASWEREKAQTLAAAIAGDRKADSEAAMTLGISTSADGNPDDPRPILSDGPGRRKIDPASYY